MDWREEVPRKLVVVVTLEAAILSDTSEFANQMSGADLFKLLRLLVVDLLSWPIH
jgi:hypothetical protein